MVHEKTIQGLRRITAALRDLEAAESDDDIRAVLRELRRRQNASGGGFTEEWAEARRRDAANV